MAACGQKNRTENVMLYCTGNKYENFLIDSQSFTKNRCILQATSGGARGGGKGGGANAPPNYFLPPPILPPSGLDNFEIL